MRMRVVICGTFHRDHDGLQRLFTELETNGCRILSPISVEFEDTSLAVVRTATERGTDIALLEQFHLRAMRDADLVWLHAPDGHVGLSAAYEVGYASALSKPVFCRQTVIDEMLQTRITQVNSVFEALELL